MAKHVGRPSKLTPELIEKAFDYIFVADQGEPFGICAGYTTDGSVIPTIEGLALFLNISRETIYVWEKENDGFSDIVGNLRNQQASMLLNGGLSGKYNPTIAKLILSGKHGYIEKREEDITSKGEQVMFVNDVPRPKRD